MLLLQPRSVRHVITYNEVPPFTCCLQHSTWSSPQQHEMAMITHTHNIRRAQLSTLQLQLPY